MDEPTENKRWIIDRIEHILDAYSRGLEINKQRFEKNAKDHLSNKKSNRDKILGFLGIAISVMLGVTSAPSFMPDLIRQLALYGVLFVTLPIGLVIFLFQTRSIRRISKEYLTIEEVYLKGITFTNFMQGFLAIKTSDLRMEIEQLNVLSDYFRIIEAGITLDVVLKTGEAIDKHILDKLEYVNLYSIAIQRGYALYETYREDNSAKARLLKDVFEHDKDLFDEFNAYAKLLREKGDEQRDKVMELIAKEMFMNPFFFSNPSGQDT
jgi:hypothetical protein